MTDIFREVEEDVRRERFEKLWNQYGYFVIAAAAAIVIAVGGWQLWIRYEQSQREANSAAYTAAMQLAASGKPLDAAAKFGEIAKDGTSGYRTIAKLAQGDALMAGGKPQDAVTAYKQVAEDNDHKELANVARIRAAWILVEGGSQAQLQEILGPVNDGNTVWRFMAREILAYSDFGHGRVAMAQAAYEKLAADEAAPAGIRNRARNMAQFLASGAGTDYGTVPAPAKPAPSETATPKTTP